MAKRRKTPASLAAWIERSIILPDTTAEPGPMKLWPWQVEIANCLIDPTIERVTLQKAARLGFTSLMTSAIGYFVVEQPSQILYLLPTEADCRRYIIDDVEALFDSSPILQGKLATPSIARRDRNTMLHRLFKGGSLKCVAGKAPRNLRSHNARVLLIDEVDAIEASAEGDPVGLAEKRTLTWPNRLIVVGGTPLDETTSHVVRSYRESDQRVFEVPCIACGAFHEIKWGDIIWLHDQPATAKFKCSHCQQLIGDEFKADMVKLGRWRITAPQVRGHAGFKINSLVALLANCAWPKLAAEFLNVSRDSARLKPFVNTVLGESWRDQADEADEAALAARAERIGLDNIPPEVLVLTAGADNQDDRIEVSVIGHCRDGSIIVLAHKVLYGPILENDVWIEFDELLKTRYQHPHGGVLKIEAAVVDAGDGGHYDQVLRFAASRYGRRIYAGKGVPGFARSAISMSKTKKGRLFLIGVDGIKTQIINRLARGTSIRFSDTLSPEYYEQLASEKRIIRYVAGKPVARFERKVGAQAEALDALVYALAARAAINVNFEQRDADMKVPVPVTASPITPVVPTVIRSQWMERQRV